MANFHDVLVDSINIGERFRKDYGDIEALKASIVYYEKVNGSGLLEPIVLDRDNNLLAGGRRVAAFKALGRPRIPAQYLDEVDDIIAREIELEENIQRKDLTIAEQCDLVREIDELKKLKYAGQFKPATPSANSPDDDQRQRAVQSVPAWTQKDTAQLLGMSDSSVSRKIAIANALDVLPELRDEESESQILKKIDRRIEELEREINFRALKRDGALEQLGQVLLGDCVDHLENLSDASVDCIIIDPPYGVLETGGIDRYESGVHFDDDPIAAMALLRRTVKELKRVIKPDGHIYVFFGIKMFVETKGIFDNAGFDVDPIPLIWVKTTGSVVDWDFRYANYYEPILFITNRTRRLAHRSSNVFHYDSVPSPERSNVAEKPVGLLRELIELSTNVGDLVLDCFAGSGSLGVAAKSSGRRFILIEKDEGQWKHIQNRLSSTPSYSSADPTVEPEGKSNTTLTPPESSVSD